LHEFLEIYLALRVPNYRIFGSERVKIHKVISDQNVTSVDPDQTTWICWLIWIYTGDIRVKCVYMEERVKLPVLMSAKKCDLRHVSEK
jgi:hypothetical protein